MEILLYVLLLIAPGVIEVRAQPYPDLETCRAALPDATWAAAREAHGRPVEVRCERRRRLDA